jgi:hypothetical protein
LAKLQASPSLAVSPNGQNVVIGFVDARAIDDGVAPTSYAGFAYSTDGGATFTDGGQIPHGGTRFGGHHDVKYDSFRSRYVYLADCDQGIAFSTSPTGAVWTTPTQVTPTFAGTVCTVGCDSSSLDIDATTGRMIATWIRFTNVSANTMRSYSDDGGTTWAAATTLSSGSRDTTVRFGPGGTANAVWMNFGSYTYAFAHSTNSGSTFAAAQTISATFTLMDDILGVDTLMSEGSPRVASPPSLAVLSSSGGIYIAYAKTGSGTDGGDIAFIRSVDGGTNFSVPVLVNSRPGSDRAQWHPSIAVDQSTGRIYIYYFDQGIATAGDLTEVSLVYSDDGGVTWSKPQPLTDEPFHAGYGNRESFPNLGDSMQSVAQNGELFAAWTGTSRTTFTEGQPDAQMMSPDIYFKRVTVSPKPSLRLGSVTYSDSGSSALSGNSYIDAGEQIAITIPLENYVTNSGSAAAVTSVSGVLSTTTAGVTIPTATSAYADIAAGTTANPTSPVIAQLAPTFVRGTSIDFVYTVTTTQGTTSLLFRLRTGTPRTTTLLTENFSSFPPAGWAPVSGTTGFSSTWNGGVALLNGSACAGHVLSAAARWDRLFSPNVVVADDAEYVTIEFDISYGTPADSSRPTGTFAGLSLRLYDQTPGRTARHVPIEAVAQDFMTGPTPFYPKHTLASPSSYATNSLYDMSAWGGSSPPTGRHVSMKIPETAGSTFQLRFEFIEDGVIRNPCSTGGVPCGFLIDNVVVKSVVSVIPTTTTLTASSQTPALSQSVTFTANVARASGPVPDGTVTFKEGATTLAGPIALVAGSASYSTSALSIGTHTISAEYLSTSGAYGGSTGTTSVTVTPAVPAGMSATATTTTSINVTWNAANGAEQYEVHRLSAVQPYQAVTTTGLTNYTDAVSAGATYVYKVRSVASGFMSAFSTPDAATTVAFTDDPLTTSTIIKAAHFVELRSAVNLMRAAASLESTTFADASLSGILIKALHVTALRAALDQAREALGLPPISYTDPTITAGVTKAKLAHVQELRSGVK